MLKFPVLINLAMSNYKIFYYSSAIIILLIIAELLFYFYFQLYLTNLFWVPISKKQEENTLFNGFA